MDRRRHLRIEKPLRCAWSPFRPLELERSAEDWQSNRKVTWIRDLSRSGCFIELRTAPALLIGLRIELLLELPFAELDPLAAVGEVVRIVDGQGFAVRFLRLSKWSAGWLDFLSRAEVFDHHRRLFL